MFVVTFDVQYTVSGIIGLDHQVEEEEEQEGTSAYFKQGIGIILKSLFQLFDMQAIAPGD